MTKRARGLIPLGKTYTIDSGGKLSHVSMAYDPHEQNRVYELVWYGPQKLLNWKKPDRKLTTLYVYDEILEILRVQSSTHGEAF